MASSYKKNLQDILDIEQQSEREIQNALNQK
jgi:hypothetical protein